MQEAIAVQIKVDWSYWSLLGRFKVPNSDERNKVVLNDEEKTVIETIIGLQNHLIATL